MFFGNYIDLVILVVFLFFLIEGFRHGVFVMTADFLGFLLSLLIALRGYKLVAPFLSRYFHLTTSFSNALGFLLLALITEFILGFILGILFFHLHKRFEKNTFFKILSIFPATGETLVVLGFVFTLILSLPLNPKIKADITSSKLGNIIVSNTQVMEGKLNDVFGGVIEDTINYLTVKPGSGERVELTTPVTTLTVDANAEKELFDLVNKERRDRGIKELTWEEKLLDPARAHAKDMWERKYFAHVSPEGEDVGNRLAKYKIKYMIAGENLALAPTTKIAHTGLMNSEGHRKNILDPEFEKGAIGVMDNGIYGKMFVQIFIK